MTLLTSNLLSTLSGIPESTLRTFASKGRLSPVQAGGPGGVAALWSIPQALALTVAKLLRGRGVALADCESVRLYLWSQTEEQLSAGFAEDRRFIMTFGKMALPRLVRRFKSVAELGLTLTAEEAVRLVLPLTPTALDVRQVWARIRIEAKRAAAPKKGKPARRKKGVRR
jgi:hypothetical protein